MFGPENPAAGRAFAKVASDIVWAQFGMVFALFNLFFVKTRHCPLNPLAHVF
jgi:hypothetical protein